MNWIISALSSATGDYVSGRSSSWWTGENSWWGKITGGGSDRSDDNVIVHTPRDKNSSSPLIYLVVAYFLLK